MTDALLNKKTMAASCGISSQAFDKWGVKPYRKEGREQLYRVQDVIDNRVDNELKKNNNRVNHGGEVIDIELERALLIQKQRITQEIRIEILEGRAIPAEFARDVLAKILSQTGATLDSLAPNIKRRHPDIDPRIIDFIKSETIKHQNEAANLDNYLDDIIDEVITQAEAKI